MFSLKWSQVSFEELVVMLVGCVCSVGLACSEVRVRDCVKEWSEWEVGRSDSCALSLVSLSNILDDHQVTGYQVGRCHVTSCDVMCSTEIQSLGIN